MAKFTNKDLRLKTGEKATFGDANDSNIWWDGTVLRLDTVISGVDPTASGHLATKHYVDYEISTISGGGVTSHGALTGLENDDHTQYVLVDGSRGFTDVFEVVGITFTEGDVQFSSELSSDGDISGLTFSGTVSGTNGQALYVDSSGAWSLAKADDKGTIPATALVVNNNKAITYGYIRNDAWNWTPGGAVYVSDDSAGDLTQTAPTASGSIVQVVGVAITSDVMFFNPDYTYLELGSPPFYTKEELTTSGVLDVRYYTEDEVDVLIASASGTTDHSALNNLDYASSGHTGFVSSSMLTTTSGDIIAQIITDHGGLSGLGDDDHTQYILTDGTRAFTGTVSGVEPTADAHLATKYYVDQHVQGLDWQESVIDIVPVASGVQTTGNRYIADSTGGGWTEDYIYEWDGAQWVEIVPNEGFAAWVEDIDALYVYSNGEWVRFGSTIHHNFLAGLQGGTSDQYYHLTQAEESALTGGGNASTYHIHDDRYYTESEVDSISGAIVAQIPSLAGYATETWVNNNFIDNSEMTTISGDIVSQIPTDFYTTNEVDNLLTTVSGDIVAQIPTDYISESDITTISGDIVAQIITDHGDLDGLSDDDHLQYILVDGSRGFTSTVSGVMPSQDYHLATKEYVDQGGVDRHGRQAISNDSSVVTVNFADLGHTDYTINATLENTTDSPPSIYAFIVSARTSSSFTVTLMGDTDSANYVLNWLVIED